MNLQFECAMCGEIFPHRFGYVQLISTAPAGNPDWDESHIFCSNKCLWNWLK
jgi:hypothetical protein